MAFLFIVNPAAGSGRTRAAWPDLERELKQRHVEYEVTWTEERGHATEIARRAASNGATTIVAVGGDGTLNEVANGVADSDVPIGLIPLGTGADFSRTLGLPRSPMAALDIVLDGRVRRLDVGLVNEHRFCNVAGTGFDAKVADRVNQTGKKSSGALPYVQALLQTLFTYKNAPFEITLDGETHEVKSLLMAVGNGRFFGGGMQICPEADVEDGRFDVCIVGDVDKFRLVMMLSRVYSGTHMTHPLVTYERATEVIVHGPADFHIQADGELVGQLPATFRIEKGGLPMRLP